MTASANLEGTASIDQTEDANSGEAGWREAHRAEEAAEVTARVIADRTADTLEIGADAAREGMRRVVAELAERTQQAASSVGETMTIHRETIESAAQELRAGVASASTAAGAITEMGTAWRDWVSGNVEISLNAARKFGQCRTMKDAAEAQRDFAREMMQGWIDYDARVLEATQHSAERALQPLRHH